MEAEDAQHNTAGEEVPVYLAREDYNGMFPHNWRRGKGKRADCGSTDEIEELLDRFADEDVQEAQVESHAKLDEVKAKICLEREVEKGLQEIEDAETRDKATLAVQLQQAIADGNDEARGCLQP
jgi:hypothetical protein